MSIDCFCPGHENYYECPVNYYECKPSYPVPAIPYVVDVTNYDDFVPVYDGRTGDIVACWDEGGYARCWYSNDYRGFMNA